MPATYRRTSSAWKTLRGNTTVNNRRTCETVSAGAFFFQPELEMPQKEMGEHTREHRVMPARILPDLVVIHPQLRLRVLEALFERPPHATEPYEQAERSTQRGVAEIVPVPRMGTQRKLDEQPHRRRGLSLLAEPDPLARELVGEGTFGPLRHRPAIPECHGQRVGQRGDGARRGVGHRHPLGALCSLIGIRVRRGGQWLEPTPRVRRRGDERDRAHTRLAGRPKVWTVAVETGRYNRLERQYPRLVDRLDHRGRQLRFALPHHRVWHLTLGPSRVIRVREPRLWQEEPLVDQGIALPRGIRGEHADLRVVALAQGAAVLAGHPHRGLPLFCKPGLI